MKLFWLKKESILKQVKSEYEYWFNHIGTKRQKRRDDKELYVKESAKDTVDIHSIFTAIETLMAIYYLNKISVKFTKRKPWDEERATNANIVAEYDYWEMNLERKDYIWNKSKFMTWVWIQTSWPFDMVSICPSIDNIDTLSYIFDPKWWPTIRDHRFFGIETEMTKWEMKQAEFENYEHIWEIWDTQQLNESSTDDARWEWYIEDFTDNKKYAVYIHWFIVEWEKYIWYFWDTIWKILKLVKLEPIFEEEKKDHSKIMFPIAFNYFCYVEWDSMWISPFDLLRSKQNAYSILFNLMLKMAYKNAMWWDRLINTEKIKDLSWLAVPTIEGKDIPVSLWQWESLDNVITYTQKDTPTQLPQELRSWLAEENIKDTWIDANTQWVLSQWNNTLWEREMAQKNANLRFLLWSKQAMWGEVFRWKFLRYKPYWANMKSTDKKEFALETWYSEDFHTFSKDDFVWSDMLNLKLQSKAEVEQEMERLKLDRIARYPQEIQECIAEWKKGKLIILQRNRMRDIWEPEDRVMKMYWYTVDELNAMDKFRILKLAIKLNKPIDDQLTKDWLRINSLDDDHEVFIEYFQTLPDWEIKKEAIKTRYNAIKNLKRLMEEQQALQWQIQQPMQQSWATNSAWNVATAMASSAQVQQWSQNWPDANINNQ